MAITRVGAGAGAGATITFAAHQAGDLIVVFAYRDGSTTAPSLPTGWTNIASAGANTNSARVGYRVATGSGTPSGTWTNASHLAYVIYRGVDATPVGANAAGGAQSTTVAYNALTLQVADGTSWVVGFAGHRSTNTSLQTPPSGMGNRATFADATCETAAHDTDAGVAAWSTQTVAVGGTSSGWRSYTVEVRALAAPAPQEITAAGNIASGEAFGVPILDRPHLDPLGITSGESFGVLSLTLHLDASGIASSESVGSPTIGSAHTVTDAGAIPSGAAFGIPVLDQPYLDALGIPTGEGLGVPAFDLPYLDPLGIGSGEAFGLAEFETTGPGAGELVGVGAVASAEAFGVPDVFYERRKGGIRVVTLDADVRRTVVRKWRRR